MANVNSTQRLTGVVVNRKEVLIDGGWNLFKTTMVVLGGAAVLGWLIWLGYWLGGSGCYTCTVNQPTPVATTVVAPPSGSAETAATIAELEKARLALEGATKAAEEKGATQVATPSTVAPPPPKVVERKAPTPEEASASMESAAPPPPLSPTERRRNEMWSGLRR